MHLQMTLIYSRHIINLIPNWFDTVFLNRKTLVRAALLITKSSNPGQNTVLTSSESARYVTLLLENYQFVLKLSKRGIYTVADFWLFLRGNITLARFSCSHTQAAAAGLPVIVGWLKEGRKLITKEPVYLGDSSGRLSQKKLFRADATQLSLELVATTTFHWTSRFSPLSVQLYTLYNCA